MSNEDDCDDCKPVGAIIDGLDVTLHMPADKVWLPVSAVVIINGINADGRSVLHCGWSDGMDWIARRGMLEIALDQERTKPSWVNDND